MRLINTQSLKFETHADSAELRYAILSHRWEAPELTFQEFEKTAFLVKKAMPYIMNGRRSYTKITRFCEIAFHHGFEWAWVDTCCIDKKDNVELSEAINSMFRWYREASTCYVYLSDVEWDSRNMEKSRAQFKASEWFKRGWTLQELLAPESIQFYDMGWNYFGDKNELSQDISDATGISIKYLTDPESASIAQKFSWAAERKTTRTEDTAYCLLGLLGVNMPMLYGEGKKAFYRLQLEVLKESDDESIFAWAEKDCTLPHGLLALSPSAFKDSGDIVEPWQWAIERPPYAMTNKGLEFGVNLPSSTQSPSWDQTMTIPLNCVREHEPRSAIMIELHKIGNHWRRVNCDTWTHTMTRPRNNSWIGSDLARSTVIYVRQRNSKYNPSLGCE